MSTEPDYSLLTQEEIEAIQAEPSPDELITIRQAEDAALLPDDADEAVDDAAVDSASDSTLPAGLDKHTVIADSSGDPVAADVPVTDAKPVVPTDTAPRYDAKLPDDYAQQLDQVKTERAALKEQYKNGELDFDEYEEQREALADKAQALRELQLKASISQEMNAQNAQQIWEAKVKSFVGQVKTEIDYAADGAKAGDFDAFIKMLANNPANDDKPMDWFLSEAHKRTLALHGVALKPAQSRQSAKDARKPPVGKSINLGGFPAFSLAIFFRIALDPAIFQISQASIYIPIHRVFSRILRASTQNIYQLNSRGLCLRLPNKLQLMPTMSQEQADLQHHVNSVRPMM